MTATPIPPQPPDRWRTGRPSPNDDQATPRDFFAMLDREFRFAIDVACTEKNKKCERFITKEMDAFRVDWVRVSGGMGPGWAAWCNPPYSDLDRWVQLCVDRASKMTVVMLVPADPSTGWWKRARMAGAEIRFVEDRLAFEDRNGKVWRSRTPNAVFVFRPVDVLRNGMRFLGSVLSSMNAADHVRHTYIQARFDPTDPLF